MKIIDDSLLAQVAAQAKASPRLRKNYNFHQSLDDKCHRFLNAMEPGTQIPVHHHPTKDETFVLLKGKVPRTQRAPGVQGRSLRRARSRRHPGNTEAVDNAQRSNRKSLALIPEEHGAYFRRARRLFQKSTALGMEYNLPAVAS